MTDPVQPKNVSELSPHSTTKISASSLWVRILILSFAIIVSIGLIFGYFYAARPQLSTNTSVVSLVSPPVVTVSPEEPIKAKDEKEQLASDLPPKFKISSTEDSLTDESDTKILELEKSVATLTATISVLQNELQSRNARLEQTQQSNQSTLAVVVAFFQLRDQEYSGHNFANEYQTLLHVSKNMPDHFQALLQQLQLLASKDIPTPEELHIELKRLKPQAENALQKASAVTWIERIKAELNNLISIRKIGESSTSDIFKPLEQAFDSNDLSSIPAAVHNLPVAARSILEPWSNQVDSRNQVNKVIHDMMNDLIEQNTIFNPQQDKKP